MPHAPCVRHSRPYASLRRLPVTRQNLCRHFPVEFPITFTKSSSNESSSCSATGISPITGSRSPSTMDGNSNGTGPEHCSALPAVTQIRAGYYFCSRHLVNFSLKYCFCSFLMAVSHEDGLFFRPLFQAVGCRYLYHGVQRHPHT